MGSVIGNSYVGGLVGYNSYEGIITNSYATGSVKGRSKYVGGLVGQNGAGGLGGGIIVDSYTIGRVIGSFACYGMEVV